jgi:hypothetical protein
MVFAVTADRSYFKLLNNPCLPFWLCWLSMPFLLPGDTHDVLWARFEGYCLTLLSSNDQRTRCT